MNRSQPMPTQAKEILDDPVDMKESLGLLCGFEASHLAFPLSSWLVRDFGPGVRTSTGVLRDGWQKCSMRDTLAAQFVGHKAKRLRRLTLEQSREGSSRRTPIPAGLHENVDHIAILIDRLHRHRRCPLIATNTSSKCQVSPSRTWRRLKRLAYPTPHFVDHCQIVA